jgi:hypothetical protein
MDNLDALMSAAAALVVAVPAVAKIAFMYAGMAVSVCTVADKALDAARAGAALTPSPVDDQVVDKATKVLDLVHRFVSFFAAAKAK